MQIGKITKIQDHKVWHQFRGRKWPEMIFQCEIKYFPTTQASRDRLCIEVMCWSTLLKHFKNDFGKSQFNSARTEIENIFLKIERPRTTILTSLLFWFSFEIGVRLRKTVVWTVFVSVHHLHIQRRLRHHLHQLHIQGYQTLKQFSEQSLDLEQLLDFHCHLLACHLYQLVYTPPAERSVLQL